MKKMASVLTAACALCLALASCVSSGSGSNTGSGSGSGTSSGAGREPAYLIKAQRDSGFVADYRAFFAIAGDSVTEISASKFENWTLGDGSDYERINAVTCVFDAYAPVGDPMEWRFKQSEYDTRNFDVQLLVWDLKRMGVTYTGSVYILITMFDNYRVVQAVKMDGSSALAESYAAFRDDDMLTLPKGADLSSLRSFYRHK